MWGDGGVGGKLESPKRACPNSIAIPDVLFHASILDYFHVMTYDFHGSWEHNVGENSPLYKGPADQGSMVYFNVVSEGFYLNTNNMNMYHTHTWEHLWTKRRIRM